MRKYTSSSLMTCDFSQVEMFLTQWIFMILHGLLYLKVDADKDLTGGKEVLCASFDIIFRSE